MGCLGNIEKELIFFIGGLEPTVTGPSKETARLYGGRLDGTDCGLLKPAKNKEGYYIKCPAKQYLTG